MTPLSIREVGLFGFVLLSRSHPSWSKKAAETPSSYEYSSNGETMEEGRPNGGEKNPDLQPLIRLASYSFFSFFLSFFFFFVAIVVNPRLTFVLFRLVNLLVRGRRFFPPKQVNCD